MRILVISQYFWPENFKINDLCLGLKAKGHEVTVLTGTPNYPKGTFFEGFSFWKNNDAEWNGIKVYRSKLIPRGNNALQLMLNYVSFPFFASLRSFFIKEEFDKILVYGLSPVTVGLPAIVFGNRKKVEFVFWVQDLWPESLAAAGGVNNKLVLNFFDWITKLIYRKSEKVLVQSLGFKDYILNQGISEDKIIFCPNSTENIYKPVSVENKFKTLLPEGFKVIFAGNLGEAQSLFTLIEAAKVVAEKGIDVKWIFLGEGRMRESLENEIKTRNLENHVFLLGAYPSGDMPYFFACADALVVSLKDERIFSLTIPSKVQSYMACERPILASLNGEGARIIEEAECGFVSPADNAIALAENVIKLHSLQDDERNQLGKNAGIYFRKEFERNILLDKLTDILKTNA